MGHQILVSRLKLHTHGALIQAVDRPVYYKQEKAEKSWKDGQVYPQFLTALKLQPSGRPK